SSLPSKPRPRASPPRRPATTRGCGPTLPTCCSTPRNLFTWTSRTSHRTAFPFDDRFRELKLMFSFPCRRQRSLVSRREMLQSCATGFGAVALAALVDEYGGGVLRGAETPVIGHDA